MDVLVDHIRGHLLRARARLGLSFAGDSFFDRARSTMLGLLGAVAAVGLAIVALAAHQDWPLVDGSPIPGSIGDSGGVMRIAPAVKLAEAQGNSPSAPSVAAASPAAAGAPAVTASRGGAPAPRNRHGAEVVSNSGPVGSPPRNNTPSPQPPAAEPVPVAAPVSQPPASPPAEATPPPAAGRPGAGPTAPVTSGNVGPSQGPVGSGRAGGPNGSSRGREKGAATGPPAASGGRGSSESAPGRSGSAPGREGTPPGREVAAAPTPSDDAGDVIGSGRAGGNGHGRGRD